MMKCMSLTPSPLLPSGENDVICCKKWKLHNDKLIFSFDCTAGEVGAIVTTGGARPPFSFEKE